MSTHAVFYKFTRKESQRLVMVGEPATTENLAVTTAGTKGNTLISGY